MALQMKTEPDIKSGARLSYLDNLRIYLTILVVLHHASIAYGGVGDWTVKDPGVDLLSRILLTFFAAVNQSFFMSAFFLLAGFFTPDGLERKGAAHFVKDRLIRLGIPLLVYTTLIINLNQVVYGVWMKGQPFRWIFAYQPGHLWFLVALLLFAVIYMLYRIGMDRRTIKKRLQFYVDRFPPNRMLIFSIVFLAALTFLIRIWFPVGKWVFPGFQLAHFAHYAFSYCVGILAYRGDWFQKLGRVQARSWGFVALFMLPLFLALMVFSRALERDAVLAKFLGGLHWQSLVSVTWESIMLIAVLTFLLHLFRERINGSGPLLRSMAASVYTVYIIHQTVLIAFNVLFLPVAIPTILKFLIVSLIVVPLVFGLAVLVRRIPYAKRVLG
jgi:glucan biosynthesis protein C